MKLYKYAAMACVGISMLTSACVDDLDVKPDDPQTKLELTTTDEWYGYLGSLYGALLYEGNISWPGYGDGDGVYMRCHWNAQELTADEAVIMNKWNDPGYHNLFEHSWLDNNGWLYLCYAREADLIRKSSTFISLLSNAGDLLSDAEKTAFAAEARVLRAYAYYCMIDMFGKGPWVTEASETGVIPPTYDRKQLFEATVADLAAALPDVPTAAQQTYGRVSREAGYMVLAKLYLNAEVYTGTAMYDKCAEACKQVIAGGFTLAPEYKYLFCGSNDKYARNLGELLWVAPQQAGSMETWGGTTYLTAGAYCEAMPVDALVGLGCNFTPWSGLKVRPELINAFEPGDKRAMFYTDGFTNSVANLDDFVHEGYVCTKYRYVSESNYDNDPAVGPTVMSTGMCDADYPIFRLADTYLMLAECEKRGVSGCEGLKYYNLVRERADLPTVTSYTLADVLHERQCELYWEGHRRSDLIRFGLFTGNTYLWSWKGGAVEGASIPDYRSVFAIPYSYVPVIGQNPGY